MPTALHGLPIAITGASSGIGAATALACAQAGMPVAIGARRADKLGEVADRIRAAVPNARVVAVPGDVAKPADAERLVDETIRAFGSIYAVYANAGYGLEVPVHEMPDAQMREIFECNFFGTLNTIRPAIPHMLRAGRGHVLICSSCVAKMALPYYGAYSATKAAQNHIGRAMALELEPRGVHVSTVHPIGTKTEFFNTVKNVSRASTLVDHSPDWFMQDAATVARHTVACLRRPRPEVWTGPKGALVRFGMSVCTLAPRLGDFFIRGMVKKRVGPNAPTLEATPARVDRA